MATFMWYMEGESYDVSSSQITAMAMRVDICLWIHIVDYFCILVYVSMQEMETDQYG